MGKRDKRVAFVNPIAAARARGPAPTSGPTIKDYLGRNRMSLEEAEELIIKSTKQSGSDSLAAWEEELNDNYRKELKKAREKKLAEVAAPTFKKKKKEKKKAKKQTRARSRSRSPTLSDSDDSEKQRRKHRKGKKRRKRKHQHRSNSASGSESDQSDESDAASHRQRKKKLASSKDEEIPKSSDSTVLGHSETVDVNSEEVAAQKGLLPLASVTGKVLLPTPPVSLAAAGSQGCREGTENMEQEREKRVEDGAGRSKATKWTDKWDVKTHTT